MTRDSTIGVVRATQEKWIAFCRTYKGSLTSDMYLAFNAGLQAADESTCKRPEQEKDRLYRAAPRGIGLDWTPGCMVCGGDTGLHHNCSFFVPSRETGEAIVGLFRSGAILDYRPFEPNWIQVKIGACDSHKPNLEMLVDAVRGTKAEKDGPGISIAMIESSITSKGAQV